MLLVSHLLTTKIFYTPTLHFETFSKDKTLYTRSYRDENHYKDIILQNTFKTDITSTFSNKSR